MSVKTVDFLWGDRTGLEIGIRVAVKLFIAALISSVLHMFLAAALLPNPRTVADAIEADISVALQAAQRRGDPEFFKNVSVDVYAGDDATGGRSLNYTLTRLSAPAPRPPASPDPATDAPQERAATPAATPDNTDAEKPKPDPIQKEIATGAFYVVHYPAWFIAEPQLRDSIEVLARNLERVAFNDPSAEEVRLCSETRQSPSDKECAASNRVRNKLEVDGPLESTLDDARLGALLLGKIQWLTLTLFLYALLDTLGLWLRWVAPHDKLRAFFDSSSGSDVAPTEEFKTEYQKAIKLLETNTVLGMLDRFAFNATLAANNLGASSKQNDHQTAVREVLRNYRDHLIEDAGAKQDSLDMLGDTILKVAFLGTVWGIGVALFAARLLDSADPLVRLAAKSQMYGGIGVGFGATMVGIVLSVLAAFARTLLLQSWSERIELSYRIVSDQYDRRLATFAHDVVTNRRPQPLPDPSGTTSARRFLRGFASAIIWIALLVGTAWALHFVFKGGLQ